MVKKHEHKKAYKHKHHKKQRKGDFDVSVNGNTKVPNKQRLGNKNTPFPQRLMIDLVYTDATDINSPGSTAGFYIWKLNDVWDCDPAIGGSSAAYMTELGQIYQYFRVYGSTCDAVFTGNINSQNQYCSIIPWYNGASGYSTYMPDTPESLRQFPNAKYKIIQCEAGLGATSSVRVKQSYTMKKLLGNDIRGAPGYEGRTAGGPGGGLSPAADYTAYWVLGVFGTDPTPGVNVDIQLKITYHCEFFGLLKSVNAPYKNPKPFVITEQVDKQKISRVKKPSKNNTNPTFMTDSVMIDKLKDLLNK